LDRHPLPDRRTDLLCLENLALPIADSPGQPPDLPSDFDHLPHQFVSKHGWRAHVGVRLVEQPLVRAAASADIHADYDVLGAACDLKQIRPYTARALIDEASRGVGSHFDSVFARFETDRLVPLTRP